MGEKRKNAAPFDLDQITNDATTSVEPELDSLLPSTYRTKQGDVKLVKSNIKDFLSSELSIARLDNIYKFLWIAGLPVPPRPLHYQLVLQREIVLCERMDMHLVWGYGRIYLKPIPQYLLSAKFWETYLSTGGCGCSQDEDQHTVKTQRSIALGFLFTYAALLPSETDFLLAQETHLLPSTLTQPQWRALVEQLLSPSPSPSSSQPTPPINIYTTLHRRFHYGELRLSRLNSISFLTHQTYHLNPWPSYSAFLRSQLGWLAATTIYIALALTAMQLGLSTSRLAGDGVYMSAAYGFSVFAILGPLVGAVGIAVVILGVGAWNWRFMERRTRGRFRVIYGGGGGGGDA
ncbi:hypothetical protein BJY04DRAFT_215784 [Aspergillus karnatakaensis]|uniref:uncharacterized protein n=1 Tax=Aspergillus karnatakaensis TaxID=1810916 RepID=UPI003CCDB4A0